MAEEKPEETKQPGLFGEPDDLWREVWKGMPEFEQQDLTPVRTIYVHFEQHEDVQKFAELIGQHITPHTRSIWYPEAEIGHFAGKAYVDETPAATEEESEETEWWQDPDGEAV